ncbi:hypothetical protein [Bradyrhizobium japonicum]|uniref:hypothetical protein n=1 Tax=Bradyrhizobium japonicum TaxID=375 RepID=UPI00209FBB9D|nr:hypothetical protein [Bradyrhizobium japonicum]MCP1764994.1 hypothetical protein [Bradyrhizobium japonicum]MCP1787131.1 hypothetical protein [Bradyrhizobium japonicum]MCP1809008.1 hypothetical protein [Bradyrhizobium japonicum]MCP1817938.1 hypothetical protein [Bradyrhizobium japonicum]MCP1870551.1 hypothetical protein [Bradyrhizobium japonicum]
MATLNNVLKVIEQHLEFPRSRSTGIARRLQEAGLLPSGAPGVPPILDEDGVLDLVVALASDTELHTAVSAVRAYHAMTPGGADLSGAPDTIPNAPIAIAVLVESARVGVAEARKSQIAVSCNWRAVAIHKPDGSVSRFSQPGAHCAHWQSNGHHKSITLTVAAIADALDDIFGKVN